MCRRLKPLLVFFFSYFSSHLHLHIHLRQPLLLLLAIPSHPTLPIPLSPSNRKGGRNVYIPQRRLSTHVEISLRSNPNGRPASHTCDRHAANLLRFVHGLIGFRDGGISFREVLHVRSVGGILYYTIPYTYTYIYTYIQLTQLTRMFDVLR